MTDASPSNPHDCQVNRIIADYLDAQRLGQNPDRDDLLRRNPELADELNSFFADQDRFGRIAEQIGPRAAYAARGEAPTHDSHESAAPDPALGTVRYFGDYELLEEIARGGMGVVYKARQVSLSRTVALKMILAGQFASPDDVERFHREAEAAANLDHPNVVPIYEVGEHQGQHFFSMKLIEGGSLSGLLASGIWITGGKESQKKAAQLVAVVARAVHHAHQRGVLHRDLKPGNILLDAQGQPHVTDFGLAKRVEGDSQLTRSCAIVGTPSYMSPEQARSEKVLTTGVDVYSLGAILYELLTDRPPFRVENPLDTVLQVLNHEPQPPRQLDPSIDRDLETICLKCLAKDPQRRYDSAAALADDLQRFLDGEPIQARPVGRGERLVRWFRRNPALGTAASLAVAALLAATVVSIVYAVDRTAYAADRSAYAADRADAAQRLEQLNGALRAESQRTCAEADRAKAALRETNRILATVAVDRAQRQHDGGETSQALLQLVEAIRFAREAGDAGLERNARATIGLWQGDVHRVRSVLPPPKPAEVIIDYSVGLSHVHGSYNYPFNDVALSADGSAAVVWTNPEARVVDPVTGQLLGPPLKGHTRIYALGISPDGKIVAIEDVRETLPRLITCYDVATAKSVGKPIEYTAAIDNIGKTIAFSPDGKILAISDEGGNVIGADQWNRDAPRVRRWDVASGKEIGPAIENEFGFRAIAWSPDAHWLALCDGDTVQVFDAASGKPVGSNIKAGVLDLAFSPDSKTLLIPISGGASLWDVGASKEIGRFEGAEGDTRSVAFNAGGTRILTGSGVVRIWDVATRKPIGPPMMTGSLVRAVAFRHSSSAIVAALGGSSIRVWDPAGSDATEVTLKTKFQPQPLASVPLAFSPGGDMLLIAGSWDEEPDAKYLDARTGVLKATLAHQHGNHRPSRCVSVAVSPDGKTGLTACWDQGGPATSFDIGAMHFVNFTPIGEIFRWDLAKGTNLGRLAEIHEELMYATFVRGGKAVLVVSAADLNNPTTLRLFDAVSGKPIGEPVAIRAHRVGPIAVSPDGSRAVSGQGFGQPPPQLWNATTGEPIGPPLANAGAVSAVAFRSDGKMFATAAGNVARFWDAATGAPVGEPMVLKGEIGSVEFSADGKTLLTRCSLPDHTGQIGYWDVPSGQPVLPPRVFPHDVSAVAFLPDGISVAAASDGDIRIWPLPLPVSDDVDRLRLRLQVWTGMELRDVVGNQALSPESWLERKQKLEGAKTTP